MALVYRLFIESIWDNTVFTAMYVVEISTHCAAAHRSTASAGLCYVMYRILIKTIL